MIKQQLVYIASPYAGEVEKNVAFARAACRYAIEQGYAPIAVHLIYPQLLDDGVQELRKLGLQLGLQVLRVCDEIWICGEQITEGMRGEWKEAKQRQIPVRRVSSEEILPFVWDENVKETCVEALTLTMEGGNV